MLRRLILLLFVFMCVEMNSQQWVLDYPSDENEMICFIGGDMSGEYNYSVGFRYEYESGVYSPMALCFDREGCYNDRLYSEVKEKGCFCYALGLADGNVFVVARCGADVVNDVYECLWFAILNPDLEVMVDEIIDIDEPYVSYGNTIHALINDKNEIVVVSQVTDRKQLDNHYGTDYDYVFYKVSKECELLGYSYLRNTSDYAEISDFTLVPNTNLYAVFGNGMNANNVESVFYIDDDLNYVSFDCIDNLNNYPDLLYPKFMCVDHWFDENGFLMTVQSSRTSGINEWCPYVLKMDVDMNVIDMLNLERVDTTDYVSQYRSMSYVDSNTIYISTFEYRKMVEVSIPNKVVVYLINDELELLGRKELEKEHFFNVLYIQPTIDKGCIVQGYVDDGMRKQAIICKLEKSDFGITTDVIEWCPYDVNVYPNPVSSSLSIDIENIEEESLNVKIFDMKGRRYLDEDVVLKGNVILIEVKSLPSGLYLYYIEDDRGRCIRNFFIKE